MRYLSQKQRDKKDIFSKKSLKTQTNDKMFFEDHAWSAVWKRRVVKIRKKRFFKKNNIEKRINDFVFSETKRFFEEAQNEVKISNNEDSRKNRKHRTNKEKWRRKEENTREKNQITKGFKKTTFSPSKNWPQKILNLFVPKSRDGDEEKRVKK